MKGNNKSTDGPNKSCAVIYLRAATAQDTDSEQVISVQRQACEQRAREMDATVIGEYIDHGSGRAFEGRPALRALLDKIAAGQNVDYLITYNEARLARSMRANAQITQMLLAAGVKLTIASVSPAQQRFSETLSDCIGFLDSERRRSEGTRP